MRLLSTIHPTQNQLAVLANIIANKEHPARAVTAISNNENLISARNMLMKLNVITFSDSFAKLTDIGEQLAKDHNIMDDAGELTDEGRKLTGENQQPEMGATPPPGGDMGMGGMPPSTEPGGGMGEALPPMEGFSSLFKEVLAG